MPAVREGDVFADKYRVERVLGEGGYGVVFAARNLELDERVAIKLLKHRNDSVTSERFLREGRAASKLRGDGIVRVFAVDQLPTGELYMVMEYLEGHDLRHEVATSGPLEIADAVDCILQTCDVIARAHAVGLIHRDIKPANLFSVDRAPSGKRLVKVLDFGIARSLDPVDPTLTESLALMGSPLYMAPEQVSHGRIVDERADIWALGTTLFELIAGRPPFRGKTIIDLLDQVQNRPPASLRELRPQAPAGLEAVIGRCLEKDRDARYPDIGSLVVALSPFAVPIDEESVPTVARVHGVTPSPSSTLRTRPSEPPPPVVASPPVVTPPPPVVAAPLEMTRMAPPQHPPAPAAGSPVAWLLGATAALLGVLAIIVFARRSRVEPPAPEAPAVTAPAETVVVAPPPIVTTAPPAASTAIPTAAPVTTSRARQPHVTSSRPAAPSTSSTSTSTPARTTGTIPDDRQ